MEKKDMKKIVDFIMQQKTAVLFIFILLIVQAFCELALPQCTSDIVDVGILSNGIESVVPECIRETQLTAVEAFLFDDDLEVVQANYKKIDYDNLSDSRKKTYKKKYPGILTESLYEWTGTEEDVKQVETGFAKAVMMVSSLSGETSAESAKVNAQDTSKEEAMALQGMDMNTIISMPEESRRQMIASLDEKLGDMDESMLSQMAAGFVKTEYEAIGVDLESFQNKYILLTGARMLALSLLAMFAAIIVSYLAAKAAGKIGRDLRSRVFKKVVSFSNAEMDKFSTASLITRSTNDIQQVQTVIVLLLRMILYAPILGLGGVFKVMRTNTSMSWIIAVAVAIIIVLVAVLFAVAMPKFKMMQVLVDKLNLVTREILTGIPVIRAFSTERYEEKRFDNANKDLTRTMLFTSRAMTIMMPTMMLLINCISLAIVWFGAKGIDKGNLQVGEMMAFMTYAMQIIMSFLMITMISIMLPRAGVAANRIDEVLKTEPTLYDPEQPRQAAVKTKGLLQFNNVSFKYPGADGYTLENISFTAKPGETTAFIGSTGSGKSTLVNLIPRFYDVTEGSIKIDGIDIRDMKQADLRDKLGFVPQKAILFSGTISSNIRYGKEDAAMEEVKRAARIAQSTDFIEEKEEQYESPIAQGGGNVSGGQKQRLSIARAIAKNPEIFVFDDSFSALDYKTDVALRKALHEETNNSTVIVVAQRISTILNADQIIVLDEGKIVGKGRHEELLKNCAVYYEIATSQLSASELAAYGVGENE